MTQEEAFYSNGYVFETAQVVGQEMKPIKEEAGTQLLDGVHAVGYAENLDIRMEMILNEPSVRESFCRRWQKKRRKQTI